MNTQTISWQNFASYNRPPSVKSGGWSDELACRFASDIEGGSITTASLRSRISVMLERKPRTVSAASLYCSLWRPYSAASSERPVSWTAVNLSVEIHPPHHLDDLRVWLERRLHVCPTLFLSLFIFARLDRRVVCFSGYSPVTDIVLYTSVYFLDLQKVRARLVSSKPYQMRIEQAQLTARRQLMTEAP